MRRNDNLDMDGGDSDGEDDEEVVYTAGESGGARNQVKIELEPNGGYNHHGSRSSRSRGAAYQPASSSRSSFFGNGGSKHTSNNNNSSNDYELKRMQFGHHDDDEYSQETGCVRVYKFFLLNLSFFIYVSFGFLKLNWFV